MTTSCAHRWCVNAAGEVLCELCGAKPSRREPSPWQRCAWCDSGGSD